MKKQLSLSVCLLGLCVNAGFVRAQTLSTIYVNPHHFQVSDTNPGTEELPVQTIQRAARIAEKNNENGVATRVIIAPGVYRENIRMERTGRETSAAITFEASEHGQVVVTGSEIWSDWTQLGGWPDWIRRAIVGRYTHPWPYRWGEAAYPPGWEESVVLEPIVRRREMLFANGQLLRQVLSLADLQEGSFYISEELGVVHLWLPSGMGIASVTIEVATRSELFYIEGKRNLTLRGLIFQHDNSPVPGNAVVVTGSSHILVEDCEFRWNNWNGLAVWVSENVRVLGSVANDNGGAGMTAWRVKNLLFEDNETSYNNWRGKSGDFTGWGVAGTKHLRIHGGIYRRHKAVGNHTRGFWLDSDNQDILIEEADWSDNLTNGVFIEASQGPIVVKDSVMSRNREAGILSTNSAKVTLEGNTLTGNGVAQVRVTGRTARRVKDWETKETKLLRAEAWTLKGNTLVGEETDQSLFSVPDWQHFLSSLTSGDNVWYTEKKTPPFKIGSQDMDLRSWQTVTGQDLDSRVVELEKP